jgi:hypothetical protein
MRAADLTFSAAHVASPSPSACTHGTPCAWGARCLGGPRVRLHLQLPRLPSGCRPLGPAVAGLTTPALPLQRALPTPETARPPKTARPLKTAEALGSPVPQGPPPPLGPTQGGGPPQGGRAASGGKGDAPPTHQEVKQFRHLAPQAAEAAAASDAPLAGRRAVRRDAP